LVVARTNEILSELKTENGQVMCSSLDVAKRFEKTHDNVLKSIQTLECTDDFRDVNFNVSNYTVEGQRRTYPMYLMTRDGFAFLVMGFTGKEAEDHPGSRAH